MIERMKVGRGTFQWAMLAVMALWIPGALRAQNGRVAGRVLDHVSGEGVAQARLTVRNLSSSVPIILVSDQVGSFQATLPAGHYQIETARVGFRSRTDTIIIAEAGNLRFDILLDAAPLAVDSLAVSTTLPRPYLGGFWERRDRKIGYYVTREEIAKKNPQRLADLFRTLPGAKVMPGPNGLGQFVSFGRVRGIDGKLCPAALYVDGRPFRMSPIGIDDFFPDMVEAIEAYAGSSRLPPQFNATGTSAGNPQCGVIAIWTRTAQR